MDNVADSVATENPITEFSDINEAISESARPEESVLLHGNGDTTAPEENSDGQEEEEETSDESSAVKRTSPKLHEKRVRKKVQRLSETLSKVHEAELEKRAKAAKQISAYFEGAKGTELGAIPLIEDSIRKTKPINLKPLHLMIYGRLGAMNEVRSNLRKFKGFGFGSGSLEYQKKITTIQQRPMNEVREVLRLLHLEVSGSREVMATRLMDFLLHPSADKVKYKGKIINKRSHSKTPNGKKRGPRKSSSKSNEASSENVSQREDDSLESGASSSEESEASEKKKPAKKRGRPMKKENGPKPPPKKRAILEDSISDLDDDESKSSNVPASKNKDGASDSDEDVPLSNLTSQKKTVYPTNEELKSSIIDLLKTVDLEQTSLKVVREQLFARYPGIDLTDKKEFINTTVKDYLAKA